MATTTCSAPTITCTVQSRTRLQALSSSTTTSVRLQGATTRLVPERQRRSQPLAAAYHDGARESWSPSATSAGGRPRSESLGGSVGGAHPDATTMNMLHCLFAMAFAALALGVLTFVGVIVQSSNHCPAQPGYSRCAIYQDVRSVISFLLGALLCCLFTKGKDHHPPFYAPERAEKVQLYAYML